MVLPQNNNSVEMNEHQISPNNYQISSTNSAGNTPPTVYHNSVDHHAVVSNNQLPYYNSQSSPVSSSVLPYQPAYGKINMVGQFQPSFCPATNGTYLTSSCQLTDTYQSPPAHFDQTGGGPPNFSANPHSMVSYSFAKIYEIETC